MLRRATITIGLLIISELILIVVPDVIGYINPLLVNIEIFYIMVLNKGIGQ